MTELLRVVGAEEFAHVVPHRGFDAEAMTAVVPIVEDVRVRGRAAVLEHAERLGDLEAGQPLFVDRDGLERARAGLAIETRDVLERTAARIRQFARAQLGTISKLTTEVPGGTAGHDVVPIADVGCYAPGGLYPLVSSVLMTAIPARVAGVDRVVLATPRPAPAMLAAAAIAGVDLVLTVGGAQAVAALAYGFEGLFPVAKICGPGNAYVTAAKKLVFGDVGVDMLAGPSELVVLATDPDDAPTIAADLLGQAEHDPSARAILVTPSTRVVEATLAELTGQLADLPTAATARESLLANGLAVLVGDLDEGVRVCNRIAPEHLEVFAPRAECAGLRDYGALFLGTRSAEVFGDYGIGPNHVLPTGGNARFQAGLSVFDFLRFPSWLAMTSVDEVIDDVESLARLEGLEAHARAARRRREPHARDRAKL